MTSRRALLAGLVVAVAVWLLVVAGGSGGSGGEDAPARPDRLIDIRPAALRSVEVRDPATGERTVVAAAELGDLRADLAPLLAIRLLPERRPEFGLEPPFLEVVVRSRDGEIPLLIGAANLDRTGVYAAVGERTGTILPRVATRLAALVGAGEPPQAVP